MTRDGAPGLLQAIDEVWPLSLRLRCWVHRMRNLETKVPGERWPEGKAALIGIRDAPTLEVGEQAAAPFLERYGAEFPAACKCLSEDLPALLNHLRLPWRLRKFVRTTNLCERSFVEERRRSKTLPRFSGEKGGAHTEFAEPDPRGRHKWIEGTGGALPVEARISLLCCARRRRFRGAAKDKTLIGKINALGREGPQLEVVNDKFGRPSYTVDISRVPTQLFNSGLYGTYHMLNTGASVNRYDVAREFLARANLTTRKLVPISSDEFPLPAPRPRMGAGRNG